MRVLGVDGGQSAIRLRLAGSPAVVEVAGVSRVDGDAVALVADAVAEGARRLGVAAVDRVVLGLSTAPIDVREGRRLCSLVAAATGAAEVWLSDDAVTAHAGALSGGPGVSVVAGTGVACLVLPGEGEPRILGGHGFLLGDEGGAFWIGSRGIDAALRAREGRGAATALEGAAREAFGDLSDLHVRLHDGERPVQVAASFATAVLAAAGQGDKVAGRIVSEGAVELADLVEAAAELMRAAGWRGAVPVALGGRLLEPGTVLRRRLDTILAAPASPSALRLAVRSADAPPLEGAVLLGELGATRYGGLVQTWRADDHIEPGTPVGRQTSAGRRYLAIASNLVDRLGTDAAWAPIAAAAALVSDALERGGTLHAFGTGHSHMLAEEIYYRAGGLVRANPILVEPLMLHEGGVRSTELERRADLAGEILHDHPMASGDVLVIASNSGGNAVGTAFAQLAKNAGVRIIAIESLAHATSAARRDTTTPRLHDIAHVVIDNGGRPGDAAVDINGFDLPVSPTSTVTGAAILNAIVAEAVELLVARGVAPEVYRSANVAGGDAANARYVAGSGGGAA